MRVHTELRALRRAGDLADAHRRRVAGEHRCRRSDAIQLGEDRSLELEVFEHRFDHKVHAPNRLGHVGGDLDAGKGRIRVFASQLALLDAPLEMTAIRFHRTRELLVALVGQPDVNVVKRRLLRDLSTHAPGADHREATIEQRRPSSPHSR